MTIPIKQLEAFYGGKFCVVRSNNYQQHPAEWHHLDDNSKNDHFANIVPIHRQLNTWCRDVHNELKIDAHLIRLPTSELRPDILQSSAIVHFADWNIPRAYGCARLASFVARRYLDWPIEVRIEYALQAAFYARHCRNYYLIYDVYVRDVIPDLYHLDSISSVLAASLFNELGDTFSDSGLACEACRMYEIALGFGKNAQQSRFRPFRFSSRLRKSTLVHGITNYDLISTKKNLKYSLDEAPNDECQETNVTNALATVFLHYGYNKEARDVLELLVMRYKNKLIDGFGNLKPKPPSAQTMVDLFQLYAASVAQTERRNQPKMLDAMKMAKHIRARSGVWPTTPTEDFWSRLTITLIKHGLNPKDVAFTRLPNYLYIKLNLVADLASNLL